VEREGGEEEEEEEEESSDQEREVGLESRRSNGAGWVGGEEKLGSQEEEEGSNGVVRGQVYVGVPLRGSRRRGGQ